MSERPKTKGIYVQSALDLVRERCGEQATREVALAAGLPEAVAPLRDYDQLVLASIMRTFHERFAQQQDYDELLGEFGAAAHRAFASSLIGRVGAALGKLASPEKLASGVVRMHTAATKSSTVEVKEATDDGFVLHYEGAIHPHWQRGLMRSGMQSFGHDAEVSVENEELVLDDDDLPTADNRFDLRITLRN